MKRTVRIAATMVAMALVGSSAAYAQATRTWVSGVGDDANPCSRTAPCKTFAGAISKTAAGGEISVLDPGGFGGVTITKSITINGEGTLAGILIGSGTSGVIVNAAAADVVTLRNLSLHGVTGATNGVRFLNGGTLIVDRVDISGVNTGVDVESASASRVVINDSTIRATNIGVQVTAPGGSAHVSIDRTSIRNASTGVDAQGGSVNVTRSVIFGNSFIGFHGNGNGSHTVNDSQITGNNVGIQAQTGSTVGASNSSIVDNTFGFGCGGGTLASTGDNRIFNNTNAGCSPGAVITVQ